MTHPMTRAATCLPTPPMSRPTSVPVPRLSALALTTALATVLAAGAPAFAQQDADTGAGAPAEAAAEAAAEGEAAEGEAAEETRPAAEATAEAETETGADGATTAEETAAGETGEGETAEETAPAAEETAEETAPAAEETAEGTDEQAAGETAADETGGEAAETAAETGTETAAETDTETAAETDTETGTGETAGGDATAEEATAEEAGQTEFTATLAGHAILPAATFVTPPDNAPRALMISGRFTGPGNARTEDLYSIPGRTFIGAPDTENRETGMSLPFVGQPVQGFSGVKALGDGTFLALSDNGFGNKLNSPDAMLMAHRFRPEWETGRIDLLDTIFLSDPDEVLPFPITTEFTSTRYLTGADFDIEAIQPVGDLLWFGDEFGPYLFATDRFGRVVFVTETRLGDRTLRSPDHRGVRPPNLPGEVSFEVRRSRGFEGMAQSVDGSMLYPLLEGPIWDAQAGAVETDAEGREILRMLEFDVAARAWTGNAWTYPLERDGNNIGDFNMISETRGLVIERDGGEGDPDQACEEGESGDDCFYRPARFKRVYLIEIGEPGTAVEKLGYVDLMNIQDPDGVALRGSEDGVFTFPFVTIEDVDMVDETHIVVGNDNNLPFSAGRFLDRQDDNEWILLEVGDMLR